MHHAGADEASVVMFLTPTQVLTRLMLRHAAVARKVVVLDCDNTLWGGAVAEEGVGGVRLDEPFLALQRFFLELQQRGILLCLCSRNEEADVMAVFEQRQVLLTTTPTITTPTTTTATSTTTTATIELTCSTPFRTC
jgi:HAD superfamily phosphatase (TIGR01681 family)